MSTQFRPLEIPPGVVAEPTKKMRSSNWAETNMVRWREQQLAPVGGQSKFSNPNFSITIANTSTILTSSPTITMISVNPGTIRPGMTVTANSSGLLIGTVLSYIGLTLTLTANSKINLASTSLLKFSGESYTFASIARRIHGWYALDGTWCVAYLCEAHLYIDIANVLYDVTPVDGINPPSGITGGYSDGAYSASTYGTPRGLPSSALQTKIPDAYSLDNFGSILYAMTSSDSRLLTYDPSIGTPGYVATVGTSSGGGWVVGATTIGTISPNPGTVKPGQVVFLSATGASVGIVASFIGSSLVLAAPGALVASAFNTDLSFGNYAKVQPAVAGRGPVPLGRCFIVTPERFILMFGTKSDGTADGGFPWRMAWCDQENPGAWDYSSVTSQAGFLDVQPASPIVCALSTRVGVIFWTAKKVYSSRFLGLPYVYNYTELGDGSTPWSPQSMVTTSSLSLWMSEQGVFSYDGTSVLPVQCMVRPWIDDDINMVDVREASFSAHIAEFNEWWWFFPDASSTSNTKAIIYNYKEGWWGQARMRRSAGMTSTYVSHPVFADGQYGVQHEVGNAYFDADLPFVETFDLNLTNGSLLVTIKQMLPDIEGDIDDLRYSLFYRNSRSKGTPEIQSVQKQIRDDGYVDFRTTGRDVRLRIDVAGPNVNPWTVGQHLIDAVTRGDR